MNPSEPVQPLSQSALANWLVELRDGESRAMTRLWDLYFSRMVGVARRKMAGARRQARDEEDIALSAFRSFCLGLRGGRFAGTERGIDLWPLLVTLTINKAIDHLRRENRKKRGGGGSAESVGGAAVPSRELDELLARDPSPGLQLIADESFARLLDALDDSGDGQLRTIALLRLEDTSTAGIAAQLGCTVRSVQRKLKTIRAIWEASG